jgi:hypothetical protein
MNENIYFPWKSDRERKREEKEKKPVQLNQSDPI